MDLRRLSCQLCRHTLSGCGQQAMQDHFSQAHPSVPSTSLVHYYCQRCPHYRTQSASHWLKHFSPDFLSCRDVSVQHGHAHGAPPSRVHRHSSYQQHERRSSCHPYQRSLPPSTAPKATCLYCPLRIPEDLHAHHRQLRHRPLEFRCQLCPHTSPYLARLGDHLEHKHSVDNARTSSAVDLVKRHVLALPIDLRGLRCRLCTQRDKFLLAQDRAELSSHVKRQHDFKLPVEELRYTCRACQRDFEHTAALLAHECCQFNGQADRLLPKPLMPTWNGSAQAALPIGDSTPSQDVRSEEAHEQCLYCDQTVASGQRATHRTSHWRNDFQCQQCSRSFPFLSDMVEHLTQEHGYTCQAASDDGDSDVSADGDARPLRQTGLDLAKQRLCKLPDDLRALECSACTDPKKKFLLAQDRIALKTHLKCVHGEVQFDKSCATYMCRSCLISGFGSTEEMMQHSCMSDNKPLTAPVPTVTSSSSSTTTTAASVAPTKESFVDLSALELEPPAEEGDLRAMACRLCAFQANGTRFFKMVEHLESEHRLSQVSRTQDLAEYVRFGCLHCGVNEYQPNDVHLWDKHFHDGYNTCCKAEKEPSAEPAGKEEANAGDEPEKRDSKDIRRLECKLCGFREEGTDFKAMQIHLRLIHPADTVLDTTLDDHVNFLCRKCPASASVGLSVAEWNAHFYKNYEWCKVSYRVSRGLEAPIQRPVVVAELSADVEMDEEIAIDESDTDLRKLSCRLCEFEANETGFRPMAEHLDQCHDNKTQCKSVPFEDFVVLGCQRCPRFGPPTVQLWDRHFSACYRRCQGSSTVRQRHRAKALYWCDACAETREDLDAHFAGAGHKKAVEEVCSGSGSGGEAGSDGVKTEVIECETCGVKVTTEGNLRLHRRGSMHKNFVGRVDGHLNDVNDA